MTPELSPGRYLAVGKWWQRAVKRLLDILISSVGLVVLSPVMLSIGLLVVATSRGGPLFLSRRVGRDGRPFWIFKFRSMRPGAAHAGPGVTVGGDTHVTPVGSLLRRTKMDELPQLMNVWLGRMSLVGPRPEDPRYVEYFSADQRLVLTVRPGITGAASVQYRCEEEILGASKNPVATYVHQILPEKCRIDLEYLLRWNLRTDLAIVWETVTALVRPAPLPVIGEAPAHTGTVVAEVQWTADRREQSAQRA